MRLILEQPKPNWNLEKIKNHISTFEFKKEFYDDPNRVAIVNWIQRFNEKVGPDGEKLTLTDLLKGLKDTQANKVTDEEYKKRLNEKFPKEKYPYWDFSNVTFRLDNNKNRVLDGLYCSKTDKNGQVHGTTDGYRMFDLLSPNKESGCRKCAEEKKYGLKVDFEKYKENFPKDRGYDFSQSTLITSPPEKTVKPRPFVKDVYCTKKDKNNKDHGLFAKDGVDYLNLFNNKTGCPKCRRNRYKGPASIIKTLVELGYDEDNIDIEWIIEGCISPKSRECRKYPLYFDIRIVDKNGKQILIEYDGIQHFEANPKRGGEERFENDIINDERKNKFTKENNIKLIRIAYTDFKNINDEVIKGLESEYQLFLSSTYPQLGWNDPKRTMPIQVTESKSKKEYIITESQLKTIVEHKSEFIKKLRRRFNVKAMRDYIYHAETEFPEPCEKFDNEFEYADAVIDKAVDDFLFQEELWEYFHSGDWPVLETVDLMIKMCKEWFEDGLLGFHQTTCQDEFDDEDFDVMSEEYEIASDKVIVRLFKLFNEYKKKAKTKKELLNIIMEYLPLFGISKVYAIYMLELYLLNFREDGDYSGLNKDNFIDPRNKSGKKTANYQAGDYTKAQLPFQGSNLEGRWTKDRNGVKYYVVKSYGWYPVYIYKEGKWYENFDRYSNSTSKQMLRSRPYTYNSDIDTNVYLMSKKEMEMLESGFSHEDVMKKKKESFRDVSPSSRLSTAETQGWTGDIPYLKIKFKISSIEDLGDKNAVNVDIYDVFKTENYKQIPTPENYLKGEIPNVTPEKIEKEVERKLRQNFREYLGPMLGNQDEELVTFRFNHLKK